MNSTTVIEEIKDVFTNHYFLSREEQNTYFDWFSTITEPIRFPVNNSHNLLNITFDDAKISFYRTLTLLPQFDSVRKVFNIYTNAELKENFDEIFFNDKEKIFDFLSLFSQEVFVKEATSNTSTALRFLNDRFLNQKGFTDEGTLLPLNNFYFTCEIPWNMWQKSDIVVGEERFITKKEKCRFLVQTIEQEDIIVLSVSNYMITLEDGSQKLCVDTAIIDKVIDELKAEID